MVQTRHKTLTTQFVLLYHIRNCRNRLLLLLLLCSPSSLFITQWSRINNSNHSLDTVVIKTKTNIEAERAKQSERKTRFLKPFFLFFVANIHWYQISFVLCCWRTMLATYKTEWNSKAKFYHFSDHEIVTLIICHSKSRNMDI